MDTATDAVDDSYAACRQNMLDAILGEEGLLQSELNNIDNIHSSLFMTAWSSPVTCPDQVPEGLPEHVRALQAFGNTHKFARVFNAAVRDKGSDVSVYTDQFQFKSLHFLLMDAMRLLNNGSRCQTVFAGSFDLYTADTGATQRQIFYFRFKFKKSSSSNMSP